MKNKFLPKLFTWLIPISLLHANAVAQTIHTVNASGGADFTSVSAAVSASTSGDIIQIFGTITGDGSAPNGIVIDKNLTLIGQGTATTILEASTTESNAAINRRVLTVNPGVTLTVKDLTIRHGYLNPGINYDGGGGIKNSGTLFLDNCVITRNHVHTHNYAFGGGILTDGTGVLTINNSTISSNTSSGWAGGICHGNYGGPGPIVLTNSTITGNSTPGRAAALLIMICTENNILTNCTFSGNSSGSYGVLFNDRSSATYTNNTFVNNVCSGGGGAIYLYAGTMTIKNNLLANNSESGGATPNDFRYQSGTVNDNGYNLIENSANYTFTGIGDITGDQASLNISATLADNGTTNNTQTFALNTGSVAIDAGATGMNGSVAVPCSDQRGLYTAATKDIGAYEYNAVTTAPYDILIETQPTNQIVCAGQNTTLSVSSSNGTYFQWVKDGDEVVGANNATLTLNNLTASAAGEYYCIVWDDCVEKNSDTVELSILQLASGTDVQVACGSYTWIDNVTYTSSNTTAMHTIVGGAANGCDSIVTLNLTINQPASGTDVQVACGSYTWIDNVTYTSSNTTATHTIVNGAANGCDSVVTLNLTINPVANGTDVHVACGSYTWIDNVTYTSSNTTATHTIVNGAANGCDSIVTLNLTINPVASGTDVHVACGSYTWIDNVTYTSSNTTATHTIVNGAVNGCDSIVTLDLTINPLASGTDVQTACGSYTWIDNVTYTASTNTTTYTIAGGAANGCDSVVTLDLTIHAVPDVTTSVSGIVITADETGADYQWIDCDNNNAFISGATGQSYTPDANGNYAVIVDNGNCTDTSACVTINSVGLTGLDLNGNVSVYPNPTQGSYTVELPQAEMAEIVVYNSIGQRVASYQTQTAKTQLELTGETGIYLIEVSTENTNSVIRLVKQ